MTLCTFQVIAVAWYMQFLEKLALILCDNGCLASIAFAYEGFVAMGLI